MDPIEIMIDNVEQQLRETDAEVVKSTRRSLDNRASMDLLRDVRKSQDDLRKRIAALRIRQSEEQ